MKQEDFKQKVLDKLVAGSPNPTFGRLGTPELDLRLRLVP